MRIHRIKLGGFGTFNHGIDIDFGSDRLGVIIGRNEAGKSTIMSAIFGILFGFKDSAVQQKFEPWDSHDEYAGEIELANEKGKRVVVRRNFIDNTAEIGEVDANGNVEPVFLGSANPRGHTDEDVDYYSRIESLVGFQDEAIFRSTVFVGQNSLQVSITDQIRKLVSGSNSTDFRGALHDLHSRFSELTMENPWGQKSKAKPRKIERLFAAVRDKSAKLETGRENYMKTMTLEQEVKQLADRQQENKKELESTRATLRHFERFCKLVRDRDEARERFQESHKRRDTFLRYKEKVGEIDEELRRHARFKSVGDEFPELVTRLKSETRELDADEQLLAKDENLLRNLRPTPNNALGGILGTVGAVVGAGIGFVIASLPVGVLLAVVLGLGLFFGGRLMATGFKERQRELEANIGSRTQAIRRRTSAIEDLIAESGGVLGDDDANETLTQYRRFKSLVEDRARRISAMRVLGEWGEIDATYQKTAEENLRCNGLMDIILDDAPYLTEIAEDAIKIAQSMEELKRRIGEISDEIEVMGEVLTQAKIDLAKASTGEECDLFALEDEVRADSRRLKSFELERDALHALIDTLEDCVTEFQEGDLTKLSEEVSEIFRRITGNRYTRVTLSPNMEPMLTKYDNTHIQPDDLSQGTQDQLFFAIRVAIARHLSKRVALPFLLDDPFVNFDEERLQVTHDLLNHIEEHQVILVTCDRDYDSWSRSTLDLDMARAEAMATGESRIQLTPAEQS